MFWDFSIYLEPLAIVPQLIVLQRYREVENLTGNYVFFLGSYRFLYILNWVYRAYHETYYQHNYVVYICGVVQTCLYIDFFYYFFLRYSASSALWILFSFSAHRLYSLLHFSANTVASLSNFPTRRFDTWRKDRLIF